MSIEIFDGSPSDVPPPQQQAAPVRAMTQEEQGVLDKLLIEAVANRDLAHIEAYVKKGANVNVGAGEVGRNIFRNGSNDYYSASAPLVHLMYAKGLKTDIADFLISEGADIDSKDSRGNTMLMLAAKAGDLEAARYFVSKGADVFSKNYYGEIVLDVARNLHPGHHQRRQQVLDVLVGALPDMLRPDMAGGKPVTEDVIAAANENKPEKPRVAPRTASFGKTSAPKKPGNKLNL